MTAGTARLAVVTLLLSLVHGCDEGSPSRSEAPSGGVARDVDEIIRLVQAHHPDPFEEISEEAWLEEAAAIREAAGEGESPDRLAARMMAWVASLRDGHTNLEPEGVASFARWYPVRFHQFSDGLYVTGATREGLELNGSRVVEIGGQRAGQVASRQAELQGADNAFGAMEERYLLSNAGVMKALDVTDDGDSLRLVVNGSGGETRPVTLGPVSAPFTFGWRFWGEMFGPPLGEDRSSRWEWRAAFDGAPVRSYRAPDPSRPPHLQYRMPYRFTRLGPRDDVFYFAFNFTQNWGDQTLAEFLERMYAAVDSVDDPRLIVDLRYNSGGDGSLILPIVHGIVRRPELDDPERLFVLTGPKTFSAAVMLVGQLAEHTEATFVGTPPGAPLNHHGDARGFVLPETGMHLTVSTLYHQSGRPGVARNVFPVDVPAPMTATAYFAGRDPALEAVLGPEDVRPVTVVARQAGVDSARAITETRTREADSLGWEGWRPFPERELGYVGYEELLQGRSQRAVSLLTLVAEMYPDSWKAWDQLGQALEDAEQVERAIDAYRRSLELDPDNTPAREAIRRLNQRVERVER